MWAGIGAVLLVVAALVPVVNGWLREEPPLARLPRPMAADPSGATPTPTTLPAVSPSPPDPGAAAGTPEYSSTSVVVSLRDPQDTRALTSRGATVVGEIVGTGFVVVRPAGDPVVLVEALRSDPDVVAVSLDYGRRATAAPTDPLYGPQQQAYLNLIRMTQAWDLRTDATDQVVAVLDTGVDTSHPDLAGRLVPGFNAVYPGSPVTDTDGHGTFVAGVIAAGANNGTGVAGVVGNGRVMPVKVFIGALAFDSDIARGIVRAVDQGASVINLSLGGPGESPLLQAAVRYATSRNVVVVAAAGNDGNDVAQYPAAFPEVLAVGATDSAGRLVDFSSFGDWVDLAAPGFTITSTYPGGSYAVGDGTSFAAPMVSGVAALVRAQNPALTATQVGDRLRAAARDAGPRGVDPYYGWGVLDAARALGAPVAADLPFPDLGPGEPNDVPERATPVTVAAGAAGTLAVEGDVDWYRIESTALQRITVSVAAPGPFDEARGQNLDPILELYDGDLALIAQADTSGPGLGEEVSAMVAPGPVFVRVRNANGAADARPYELAVTVEPEVDFAVDVLDFATGIAAVGIGELTGDGRPDVAVLTTTFSSPRPNDKKLLVLAQTAAGGLDVVAWYTPGLAVIQSMALADVDQDGRLDVVIGGSDGAGNNSLMWFRQGPDGTLANQGLLVGNRMCHGLLAVDLDGDGDTDLLCEVQANGVILLTHGDGTEFTMSTITTDAVRNVAAGDVDGDGRLDIASGQGPLWVYHNRVDGWVRTDHQSIAPNGSGGVSAAAIGDVTGDGRNDVVGTILRNSPNGVVNVFAQNEDGTLAAPVMYDAYQLPAAVKIADVNGDGRNDVVLVNTAWRSVSVLYQRADGTLSPRHVIKTGNYQGAESEGLAVGDINNDGINDVVVAGDESVSIIRHRQPVTAPSTAVRSVSPVEYSTGAAVSTTPQVVFASAVDGATVNGSTVRVVDGRTGAAVAGSVAYDPVSRTATFTPAAALHRAKPYRIVVVGVRTVDGSPVPAFASTFTTTESGPLPELAEFAVRGQRGTAATVTAVVPVGDVGEVIVRYASGSTPPSSPTAGSAGYAGAAGGVTVGGLTAGQTYSFAVWYRDRAGNLSPRSTATLVGTTLTLTAGTVSNGSMTFTGTVSTPGGPGVGVPVAVVAACAGPVLDTVLGTATGGAGGQLSLTLPLGSPRCTYRFEINDSPSYMGGSTAAIRVTADPAPRRI